MSLGEACMIYVLVVAACLDGCAIQSIEFDGPRACEEAAQKVVEEFPEGVRRSAFCQKKQVEFEDVFPETD